VVVETQDGARFPAIVVAKNVDLDWALLKPDSIAPFLSMMPLSQGETPAIGEGVVVIGSPGGLKGTVTTGIVSQLFPDGVIQLNVAINPGNSGGPVFNMKGQVFGIATAKYTGGDGLGFAIPLSRVRYQ
jgi:serine protease Do